jgi:hypothetical protein
MVPLFTGAGDILSCAVEVIADKKKIMMIRNILFI